jgi:hypothetical protein
MTIATVVVDIELMVCQDNDERSFVTGPLR